MNIICKLFPILFTFNILAVNTAIHEIENGVIHTAEPMLVVDSLIISHPSFKVGEDTLYYYPTWSENLGLVRKTGNNLVTINPALGTWKSSNPSVMSVMNGRIHALTPGTATITVEMNNVVNGAAFIKVNSPSRPPVVNQLPSEMLEWGNECAIIDMPVLIIRYLPTSNGVHLDVHHAPGFFDLASISLASMEQRLVDFDYRIKFALEEGTRFRDYGRNTENPYLGYRVVAMITVYEPSPRGKVLTTDVNGLPVFGVDFFSMFERLGVENYIRNLGVKEIWFWQYGMDSSFPSYDPALHRSSNFRLVPESNMASPLTGDISNSYQIQDDLPIYDKTYIVYGQDMWRSQAEALHNHGHQIERMIPYFNRKQDGNEFLFWRKFVGQDVQNNFISGRCGWTHMPPNTTGNYDYLNETAVLSDIKNWNPNGGLQEAVNVNTWGTIDYAWPGADDFQQRIETQWYLFWFQSIPGHLNTIDYNSKFITNWWEIIADWDLANSTNFKLYRPMPDSLSFADTRLVADICEGESYNYAGMQYSQPDDYYIRFQTKNGCDSIVLLTLHVHTLVVINRNETICAGESIMVGGEIFEIAGEYEIHLGGLSTCDTLIEFKLIVDDLDKTIKTIESALFANQGGVMYQWLDCNTGQNIVGENKRLFRPLLSGSYSVRMTSPAGCVVVSECMDVILVASVDVLSNKLDIYPNPCNNFIYIKGENLNSTLSVNLFDQFGKIVLSQGLEQNDYLDVSRLNSGLYCVTIADGSELVFRRIVITK